MLKEPQREGEIKIHGLACLVLKQILLVFNSYIIDVVSPARLPASCREQGPFVFMVRKDGFKCAWGALNSQAVLLYTS